ncbi:methylated-DNA--[protein]-cysteine S-methyltransferase (plasmid) [Rhizobium pusense]|uniref:Methylated-DNA--[protein]-cysteine S-methyltransferase n=1 Tax=Agrobacterium pusense TaxID=648995 RepID=A0AA44IXK5_9HYPH|nr:methylated-DNA--[protein]-cysteine S-methyltransferase [Agrobacterium pusense]NRF18457.1 methylated-DNA--[protein]-cysteine S-methyltransferase [Agrobacterium pusense]
MRQVFNTTCDVRQPLHSTRVGRIARNTSSRARTYSEIARQIDRPTAIRAVARATGANQIALMIPCHRVIGADGSLTGYDGGLWRKRRLIESNDNIKQ